MIYRCYIYIYIYIFIAVRSEHPPKRHERTTGRIRSDSIGPLPMHALFARGEFTSYRFSNIQHSRERAINQIAIATAEKYAKFSPLLLHYPFNVIRSKGGWVWVFSLYKHAFQSKCNNGLEKF